MDKIVFVGSFTPMQKVLYAIKKITNLKYLALYTRLDDVVIKKLAVEQNIKVNNIDILRTQEGKDELRSLEPDWIFNVNSTFIFPKDILSIPRFGSLNLHPGKLPEYAGLHTHQWAIRNDERSFASTMNWMDEEVDAGPIAYVEEFPITEEDTGLSVFMKCMDAGANVALRALNDIAGQKPPRIEQNLSSRKLYSNKDAIDGEISWQWPSRMVHNFIRAADYLPFKSPTYIPSFILSDGRRVHILKTKPTMRLGATAGQVLEINDEGVVVTCGDGIGLLIEKISDDQNVTIKGRSIAEYFGCTTEDIIVL